MAGIHAKLSASGAKKWLNCPGSVGLEGTVQDSSSVYAEEGSNAHSLGEAKIRLATKALTRVKYAKEIKDLPITEDMESYTDDYRDFVIERFNAAKAKTPDAILLLEQRLDFSYWVPEAFGTGDCVIIADGDMEIIDLKYGQGVSVSAEDNPQLRLYALGALDAFDFMYNIQNVIMTIYQPRLDNISSETLSAEELLDWGANVAIKAKAAFAGSAEYNVGGHCDDGFCKARPFCRAYADERNKLAALDFKQPPILSIDEIAEVIEQAERLSKWATLVKDYALDQALNHDVKYPGYKLVEGRSNRVYGLPDTEIAAKLTKEGYAENDVWVKKIKGITDMEKLLSKKVFNTLLGDSVVKPAGKPTLVPMEDNRPELNTAAKAAEDFQSIINN